MFRIQTKAQHAHFSMSGMCYISMLLQKSEGMDRAWRGAEAYHFWTLAQAQVQDGQYQAALRTALNTRRYVDALDPQNVFSLLALAALCTGHFGIASKAFMKLESLSGLSASQKENIASLASSVFMEHLPQVWVQANLQQAHASLCKSVQYHVQDPNDICEARYLSSGDAASHFLDGISSDKDTICIASGRVIQQSHAGDPEAVLRCPRCRHEMLVEAIDSKHLKHCPLCHAEISTHFKS